MSLSYKSKEQREKERQPHPIWRGIGCMMMIVIPIFSFGLSIELLPYMAQNVRGFYLPYVMLKSMQIVPGVVIHYFWAVVSLTVIISVGLYAFMAVLNAILYSMSGNTRTLRRFEAPPVRRKKKRR